MGIKEEAEGQGAVYNLKLALEDIRNMLPDALKNGNGIVGSIFSMAMQCLDFFGKISARFGNSLVDLTQKELQAEGARDFLTEMKKLHLSADERAELLRKWRLDVKDRSAAWVALAEHFIQLCHKGMESATNIIDRELTAIKKQVSAKSNPDNLLVETAALDRIEEKTEIQNRHLEHEYFNKETEDQPKDMLGMAKAITHHYNWYKDNAFDTLSVVFNGRPDSHIRHAESEKLNTRLPGPH